MIDKKLINIAIVGFGSIGQRHYSNLIQILKDRNLEFKIDLIRHQKNNEDFNKPEYIDNVILMEEVIDKFYDFIIISNPTDMHFDTLRLLLHKSEHFFIEKPIFDRLDYEIDYIINFNKLIYVACPLRHTDLYKYLKNNLNGKINSVRVISSSYLPDWRKNSDYKKSYSAKKSGGVTLDLIHEWDYLIDLFGEPHSVSNFKDKVSNLDVFSDDLSIYIAKYNGFYVELHLDYFGRFPIRELLIMLENETIKLDFIYNHLEYLISGQRIQFEENRNQMYVNELNYFFDLIIEKSSNMNDMNRALVTLKTALGESK